VVAVATEITGWSFSMVIGASVSAYQAVIDKRRKDNSNEILEKMI
jgi:hypothetical protein